MIVITFSQYKAKLWFSVTRVRAKGMAKKKKWNTKQNLVLLLATLVCPPHEFRVQFLDVYSTKSFATRAGLIPSLLVIAVTITGNIS